MAIQLDLQESNYGVPFAGAYFRVVTAAVTRQRIIGLLNTNTNVPAPLHKVMIDVVGYATKPENEDTKDVDFRRYHAPLTEVEALEGSEFLEKCYKWVMVQDDMNGSIAV